MSLARRSCVAILVATMTGVAQAQIEDPWVIKVGAHDVNPKSDNGTLAGGALAVEVGSSLRPSAMLEYLLTRNIGIELLAAWPFEHNVKLNGVDAAQTRQLPPTLSLQYHFLPQTSLSPFVGVGLNFTRFFNVNERGPLTGADLTLGNSWGFAAHGGLDWRINEQWLAGVDLRWIDIDTTARVNGVKVGTVNVDPLVYGAYVGYRF